MKKLIIALPVIVLMLTGLFFAYKAVKVPEENIVVDTQDEMSEYLDIIYDKPNEETLEDRIAVYTTIEFPVFITRFHKKITCEVTYPDLKSYFLENQEELMALDEKEFEKAILSACETAEKKVKDITFQTEYMNGYLFLDSENYEYNDAKSGGILGLMTEIYEKEINEMLGEAVE